MERGTDALLFRIEALDKIGIHCRQSQTRRDPHNSSARVRPMPSQNRVFHMQGMSRSTQTGHRPNPRIQIRNQNRLEPLRQ